MITIENILEIEPRLKSIVDYANKPEQKQREYYDILFDCKVTLGFQNLVGFFAEKSELQTLQAYDCFYKYILDIIYSNSKVEEDEFSINTEE